MLAERGVICLVGGGGKTSLMFKLAHELAAAGETVLTTTTTKILKPDRDQSSHLIVSPSPSSILNEAEHLLQNTAHISAAAEYLSNSGKLKGFEPRVIDRLYESELFQWIIVEADGAAGKPMKAPAPYEPVIPACTKQVIGLVGLGAIGKPFDERTVFRKDLVAEITGLSPDMAISVKSVCDILIHPRGIFQGTPAGIKRIVFLNQADLPGTVKAGRSIIQSLEGQENIDLAGVVLGSLISESPVLEYLDLCSS